MMRPWSAFILFALVAGVAAGQNIAVTASPSTTSGAPVVFTAHDTSGAGIILASPCIYTGVFMGSPTGPSVAALLCFLGNTPVAPCGSHTSTSPWNPGSLPPGEYFFRVPYWDAGMVTMTTEWACVTVQASPQDPTLSAAAPPMFGQPLSLAIASPLDPGAPYILAASFTSNVGIPLTATQRICLDVDPLFDLTFPDPNVIPGVFINFQAGLDGVGASPPILMVLPPAPGLCLPLKVQALLFTFTGVKLTNSLSLVIN